MKLASAKVKNYRLHRECSVEFDPGLTVIAGPNESGKSTFIEAIHHCLFAPHKKSGQFLEHIKSNIYQGTNPEVEVVIETSQGQCRIEKVFAGPKGHVYLEQHGESFQGERAEERLLELLSVDKPGPKVGIEKLRGYWSHLWVWQGKSGENAASHIEDYNDRLLRALQSVGGAVVVQSELDERISDIFAQRYDEIFTKAGKHKKHSEQAVLEQRLLDARDEYEKALQEVKRLELARQEFMDASERIEECKRQIELLKLEKEKIEKDLQQAERVQKELEKRQDEYDAISKTVHHLDQVDRKIKELKTAIERINGEKERLQRRLSKAKQHLHHQEKEILAIETEKRRIRERLSVLGNLIRFYDGFITLLQAQEQMANMQKRGERRREIDEKISAIEKELAGLPEIDKTVLSEIRKAKTNVDKAGATKDAIATGIEIVKADLPVVVGGKRLLAKDEVTVTQLTEIEVGDGVVIAIRPGGGDALQKAIEEEELWKASLSRLLDRLGIGEFSQAEIMFEKRQALLKKLDRLNSELKGLGGREEDEAISRMEKEIAALDAEVRRRREAVQQFLDSHDHDLFSARHQAEAVKDEEEKLLEKNRDIEDQLKVLRAKQGTQQNEISSIEKELTSLEEKAIKIKAQIETLEGEHGTNEDRRKRLAQERNRLGEISRDIEALNGQLSILDPAHLNERFSNIKNELDETQRALDVAKQIKNKAAGKLEMDGSTDPQAELSRCKARLDSLEQEFEMAKERAEAIKLLHNLFSQEISRLADSYSAPLSQKINTYIKYVLGPEAKVKAVFQQDTFQGIRLSHIAKGVEFDFDSLSGGTREQVSAAVRLAIAELLAPDFGGSLPVIFDDAFTNTDTKRLEGVRNMLSMAVKRGLQVIVLTSNQDDYIGIGAKKIQFSPLRSVLVQQTAGLNQGGPRKEMDHPVSALSGEDEKLFMKRLAERGGHCGNKSLMAYLGWDEERYWSIQKTLVNKGRITTGRGRGGSVETV